MRNSTIKLNKKMQKKSPQTQLFFEDPDQGQRYDSGGRGGVLPCPGRHHVHSQR